MSWKFLLGAAIGTVAIQATVLGLAAATGAEESSPGNEFGLDCSGEVVMGEVTYAAGDPDNLPLDPKVNEPADTGPDGSGENVTEVTETLMDTGVVPDIPNADIDVSNPGPRSAVTTVTDQQGADVITVAFDSVDGQWKPETIGWCVP